MLFYFTLSDHKIKTSQKLEKQKFSVMIQDSKLSSCHSTIRYVENSQQLINCDKTHIWNIARQDFSFSIFQFFDE